MLSHTGTLWHYLGSFVIYTLAAIGLIYGAYWYSRRAAGGILGIGRKAESPKAALAIEFRLALEPRKTLYVVRSGNERFLIAASGEATQLLTALEKDAPAPQAEVVQLEPVREKPWYAESHVLPRQRQAGFKARFVQSVQWLVSSRTKMT